MSIINTALIQKVKKIKADKTNVLELDQLDPYTPTLPYHPATKEYVDKAPGGALMKTTERTLIDDNKITLSTVANGDIVHGFALIFDDLIQTFYREYTVTLDADRVTVHFDPIDNLNGFYAVVSYTSPL